MKTEFNQKLELIIEQASKLKGLEVTEGHLLIADTVLEMLEELEHLLDDGE